MTELRLPPVPTVQTLEEYEFVRRYHIPKQGRAAARTAAKIIRDYPELVTVVRQHLTAQAQQAPTGPNVPIPCPCQFYEPYSLLWWLAGCFASPC